MAAATKTMDRLLDKLLKTPAGMEVVAQEKAEAAAERLAHIKALTESDKRANEEAPRLRKALDAAQGRRADALKAVERAQAEFNIAHSRLMGHSANLENTRAVHERALEATSPPAISDLIHQLQNEFDRLRHVQPESTEHRSTALRNLGQRIVTSNRGKINARIVAVRDAIEQARVFQHQCLSEIQLTSKLAQLWNGLPDIDLSA